MLPSGGTIAALAGPPGAFWASDRLRCFKEDIAGSAIRIVAEQTSEQDAAVALSLANNLLQRFPNIDMLYGADDTYGIAAARAAQGTQKCGKVKVVFAVLGEAAEEMMRLGCADFVVAQQPVLIGRTAIQLADKLVKGVALDKKLVEISLVPVTKGNLDSIDKVDRCKRQKAGRLDHCPDRGVPRRVRRSDCAAGGKSMDSHRVRLRLNQQQLELIDNTVSAGEAASREDADPPRAPRVCERSHPPTPTGSRA